MISQSKTTSITIKKAKTKNTKMKKKRNTIIMETSCNINTIKKAMRIQITDTKRKVKNMNKTSKKKKFNETECLYKSNFIG